MPDKIAEQINLIWGFIGGMAMVIIGAVGGFARIVWNRGEKFVLKETCTQCQSQWHNEFKSLHEEMQMIISLMTKDK